MRFVTTRFLGLIVVTGFVGLVGMLPTASLGIRPANATGAEIAAMSRASFVAVAPNIGRDGLAGDPAPAAPLPYPAATRTGIPEIDAVLDALEVPGTGRLQALFIETPAPCVVNPQGITNPPLCPAGLPAGTPVPVFRATACESVWPHYLPDLLGYLWSSPRPLLAVYRDPTDAYGWLPAADFAVLVRGGLSDEAGAVVVRISGGRVNGIQFGCGQAASDLLEGVSGERFMLPLLDRLPVAAGPPAPPENPEAGLIVCFTVPCPGYFVRWTDASADENGFVIYWRETTCAADEPRPPATIATASPNSQQRDELPIPFREGCWGEIGVAAYNGVGFSTVVWAPLP